MRGVSGGVWETCQDTCFDWGVDIRQLNHRNACVWHADDDNAIAPSQGKWLAAQLKAHYRHEAEGFGHLTYCQGSYLTPEGSMLKVLLDGR